MGSPSRNVQYHPPRLSEDRLNLPQPHSPSLLTHCSGKSGMRPIRRAAMRQPRSREPFHGCSTAYLRQRRMKRWASAGLVRPMKARYCERRNTPLWRQTEGQPLGFAEAVRHGRNLQCLEQSRQGHVVEPLAARAREHERVPVAERPRRVEDLFGAARQRHPVLPLRLGPRRRDGPHVVLSVDLGPLGPAHLAGPSRREHEELERQLDDGGRPRRSHRLDHVGARHLGDGQLAEPGEGEAFHARQPVLAVLGVAPAGPHLRQGPPRRRR